MNCIETIIRIREITEEVSNMKKQSGLRFPWIDMARGIAMLIIIIGHCDGIPQILRHAIFSFHIPLFFVLSGYVYKKKDKSIKKDLRQLIVPYIITVCVVIVFNVWGARRIDLDIIKNTVKVALYGYGSANGDIGIIGAIWFLPTMFIARRLINFTFSLELRETYRLLAILLLMILGVKIGTVVWVPLNVDIAMVASGFMYIGYLLRNRNISLKKDTVAGCLFIWFAAMRSGGMEWSSRMYEPWMINFAGAVAGSIIVLYLCQKMERIMVVRESLSFVGKHTILLLCIHDLDWRLPFDVYGGFLQNFQREKMYFFMSVLCRMGFDLFVMLICLLIYKIVKNVVSMHTKMRAN